MIKSRTIIAVPPGETIREQLEMRGMTQKEFALRMDMSEKHISQLITGQVHLTPDVAVRLEATLGLSAVFWNNLEARYQERVIKAKEENAMDADIELARQMPYTEITNLGWIEFAKKAVDKVRNLRKYFEVAHLGVIEHLLIPGIAYRRIGKNSKSDYVLAVWSQKARLLARGKEVKPINLQRLSEILSDIRKLTLDTPENFSVKLTDMLADCGIVLVFLPHLKGSFLHGASFMDGKKIVTALTLRGMYADKFWFSLFHEIGHILAGDISKFRELSEDEEKQADSFARDTLISPEDYDNFKSRKDYSYSSVVDFASQIGVDAGIVVGRLQNEGELDFDQLNGLRKQYEFTNA